MRRAGLKNGAPEVHQRCTSEGSEHCSELSQGEMGLEVSARILERLAGDPSPEGVKAFIGPAGYFGEFEREVVSVPDMEQEQEF